MGEHERTNLTRLQHDLEQATADAKRLTQRLAADLQEQTRQRETHLLDVSRPPRRIDRRK